MPDQKLQPPFKYIKVFISHTTESKPTSEHYDRFLSKYFTVWTFEPRMLPGGDAQNRDIDNQVRDAIRRCDYFVLLVCDSALSPQKPYCSRELGLALELQRERLNKGGMSERSLRPIIIPIYVKDMQWRAQGDASRPTEFPVRNFQTGEVQAPYAFIGHDPHSKLPVRTDEELREFMRPRIHLARRDIRSDREMVESGIFELYEALFPPEEQDDRHDILNWVFRVEDGQPRTARLPNANWSFFRKSTKIYFQLDAFFYYISLYGTPAAFSYLDYHPPTRLLAGNYIAVGSGWRGSGLIDRFRAVMSDDIAQAYPQARGILFQVEPVDFAMVRSFLDSRSQRIVLLDDHPLMTQIRRLKRLEFYQKILHASVYVDAATRQPLVYTDPCLDIELEQSKWRSAEVDYWLMWCTSGHSEAPNWREAVNFSALEIQAKSIAVMYPNASGAAYWNYATRLAGSTVARGRGKRVVLDMLPLKEDLKRLRNSIENFGEIAI